MYMYMYNIYIYILTHIHPVETYSTNLCFSLWFCTSTKGQRGRGFWDWDGGGDWDWNLRLRHENRKIQLWVQVQRPYICCLNLTMPFTPSPSSPTSLLAMRPRPPPLISSATISSIGYVSIYTHMHASLIIPLNSIMLLFPLLYNVD